jgi:DEAD/DEAH box helicase domain-containing protein
MDEVRRIADLLLAAPCQTIYFANTRRSVEILLKYLRDAAAAKNLDLGRIMGYRGGYLPDLRRGIEQGLRAGAVTSVVATNALELGIDIGRLDCCVMLGYPGTVSSTFQRAGRVGRRRNESLVLMVARSFAMDQYVVESPDYLFDAPREMVAIHPDNLIILASHLKCATFELPFRRGDGFGRAERVEEILDFLTDELHLLVREGDRWHFAAPTYPADGVSLSAADADNVIIFDAEARTVLAEVDRASAITEVHEGAVYGHQGDQFLVEELDFENRRARVRRADVDYYTEAEVDTDVKILHVDETVRFAHHELHLGEVHVATLATGFKKIRFYTRENIGAGDINLPPEEMETEAAMLVIGPALAERTGLVAGGDPSGLRGVAALVQSLVPLFVRTDPGDVRVKAQVRSPHFQAPALILYDKVPNGVGLSEALFRGHRQVLEAAHGRATRCPCRHGCPGCTGPGSSRAGKRAAIAILEGLLA